MKLDDIKEEFSSMWNNVSEGWKQLTDSAAGALTRFRPGQSADMPGEADVDDPAFQSGRTWAMLGGDIFEDDANVVVRLEVPGMQKDDFNIIVQADSLVVSGEKRFAREETEGRWRVMQCAYGSFRRVVPLAVPVIADAAQATYSRGVLRIALPKAAPGKPSLVRIPVR